MLKLRYFFCTFLAFCQLSAFATPQTECISCNSTEDGISCILTPHEWILPTCISSSGHCYTNLSNGQLTRGCVGDENIPDIEKCSNSPNCELCSVDNFCNNPQFFDICLQCDGGDDCKNTPGLDMTVPCSFSTLPGDSTGCYLNVTNEIYTRGCVQHLDFEDRRFCLAALGSCRSCSTPNCNEKTDFTINCFECTGQGNSNCANGLNMSIVQCDDFSRTCGIGIDAHGYTHRGCFSSNGPEFPLGFEQCFGDLCNDQIYPKDRIQCFQCEGKGCKDPKELKVCTNVEDQCYTYTNEDGEIYRGCMTDDNTGSGLCMENHEKCELCYYPGCNFR